MRMHTKSLMSRYEVIIEDTECPKVHIVWIIVISKRKKMLGFEPAMLGCVALMRWYDVDFHTISIGIYKFLNIYAPYYFIEKLLFLFN